MRNKNNRGVAGWRARNRSLALMGLAVALALGAERFLFAQAAASQALENTPEVHLERAHKAFQQHRLRLAEREFRAALALNPRLTVQARFPLAVVLFEIQDIAGARKEFDEVRAQTGDNPNVNYYLGRLDLMEGKLPSAVHNLTIAAADPPFPDTDFYLGFAYLKQKKYGAAERWLNKAAQLAPRDARVHEHLGLLDLALGRKPDANREFALASTLRQQAITATQSALDCGRALDTEPLAQARAVCHKLDNPADLGSLVSLGTLYGQHQDYEDALAPFQLAAKLDPDSYQMQYNLGLTYFRLKRYADACPPLKKAVALRPDLFETNAPLGASLFALGNDAAAFPVLDHANRLEPHNEDVAALLSRSAMNLADESIEKRDTAQARAYLLRASAADPADPRIHRQLAHMYRILGDSVNAQRELKLAENGNTDH